MTLSHVQQEVTMSWAAHNPEKYDELTREGILVYMDKVMDRHGFQVPGEWMQGYEALIEVAQKAPELQDFYHELIHLAAQDIATLEREYFTDWLDNIKEERESNP